MNLTPIYELRNRLRTAMIAGTNLLLEDFRLKRAVEDIKPLEAASPVFAKISQMASMLLSESCENKEGVLIDTITLVDALLCTQGQVTVNGEIEPIVAESYGSVVTNAPYSVVKKLVEALTKSGEGRYQFVLDTHKEKPELFKDYRVKSAMVLALGASYAELAEQVAEWLKEERGEIVPFLKKNFDPKGKKEMVRRVQVMEEVAGAACNDFYVQMIPDAEKEIKNALIYALRHRVDNVELLLELAKNEKGKAKKTAYYALSFIEDEQAEATFRKMYDKKPAEAMKYIKTSTTKWASKMVAEKLKEQISPWTRNEPDINKLSLDDKQVEILQATMEALLAKNGEEICEIYRMALEVNQIYFHPVDSDEQKRYTMRVESIENRYELKNFSDAMAYFLEVAIRTNPDEGLCKLAIELYENKEGKEKRLKYFPAALIAKLISGEECSTWFKEQVFQKSLLGAKRNSSISSPLSFVVRDLYYDRVKKRYVLKSMVYEEASAVSKTFEQCVCQDIAGWFTDILIEFKVWEIDMRMIALINPDDEKQCKKLEDYFYKRAFIHASGHGYWPLLQKCGSRKCEGLFVNLIKKDSSKRTFTSWDICSKLLELPGDAESFEKEAMEVYKIISEGKIEVKYWNEITFFQYVEKVKEKKKELFGCN